MSPESSNDTTLQLIVEDLLYNYVPVGNVENQRQYVKGKIPASTFIKELYSIVPDNVYRPEVYIAFDFASTFTSSTTFETGPSENKIKAERLVSASTISRVAVNLSDYVQYYHNYILSYGSSEAQKEYAVRSSETGEIVFTASSQSRDSEDAAIEFINKIINYFLTSVTVNRVKNDVSTCNLVFRDNVQFDYTGIATKIFFDQSFPLLAQLFVPMIPFTVWTKGRLFPDYLFPIFTGYVTRATNANNQGFATFKIDGRDCLELARIAFENINPSILGMTDPNVQPLNLLSLPFYNIDHIELVRAMFIGGALDWDSEGRGFVAITSLKEETKSSVPRIYPIGNFEAADEEPGDLTPAHILDKRIIKRDNFSIDKMLSALRDPKYIVSWGYNLTPYKAFGTQSFNTYTSSFSNRLELLKEIASMVYYEFYTDGFGNVHYHPMRLANDFLFYDSFYPKEVSLPSPEANPPSITALQVHKHPFPYTQVVSNHELTGISKTNNVEELVTYLVVDGVPPYQAIQEARLVNLTGFYRDDVNIAKFGYRRKNMTCPLLNVNDNIIDVDGKTKPIFEAIARVLLDFLNGQLYTMTASLVFRPELELALPVFVVEDREVFYVSSISHTIDIGNSASTTFNANFGRREDEPEVDLISYMLHTELLTSTAAIKIRSIGNVDDSRRNLDFVIPLTLSKEYRNEKYEELTKKNEELNKKIIQGRTSKV